MIVKDFVNTIYAGLTQRGATLFVSEDAMINFTNYALNDIFSYEGRYWSFMHQTAQQIVIPDTTTTTYYTQSLPVPIIRLQNLYDKKLTYSLTTKQLNIKVVNLNVEKSGDCYFLPFTKTVTVYNNDLEGYQLDYIGWFNRIVSLNEELPIPDSFTHALYDLVMSYILPVYAQYGENRETNMYQRGMNKLKELSKADALEISKVISNVK